MLWMAVGSFVVGAPGRVFAAHNDLWFDEVWTLELLGERIHSFGDVFTNIKHSNNHHLCSLWMWSVGQNASALMDRLPSVLASIGTIVLAGLNFRNAMLVNYYKRHLARPDSMRYTNGPTLKDGGAAWLILLRFELTRPLDRVPDVYRNTYQL